MSVQEIYPLSPMQDAMLFHHLSSPHGDPYFEQQLHRLPANLDVEAFRQAWAAVIERHPALRSSVLWEDVEEPLQVVHHGLPLPFVAHDWTNMTGSESEQAIDALAREDRKQQVQLAKPQPMRLTLVRLGDNTYRLLWSYHHIFLDRWSRTILYDEVSAAYEALASGRGPHFKPAPGYREYIRWIRRQDRTAAEAFWKQMLSGFGEASRPKFRRSVQSSESSTELCLAEVPSERPAAFCRRNRITLSTLVQGAWALVLSRYSNSPDVCFGVTVSGRPPELEGADAIVGLFINTLPLRVTVGDQVASTWLQEIQRRMADIRQFEYASGTDIQRWSGLPGGQPLFESVVVFQNTPAVPKTQLLAPVEFSEALKANVRLGRTSVPLTLRAENTDKLSLRLAFDPAQFDAADIDRMLGHVVSTLEALSEDEANRTGRLPRLTTAEEKRFLFELNNTRTEVPPTTVHALVEAQSGRSPQATAVQCGVERLTYAELDRRAARLAAVLRSRGVETGTIVGVSVPRSVHMLVAVLAVLKAGGAYLPLDPAYPQGRRQFMIDDSGTRFLISHSGFSGSDALRCADVIEIDADWETAAGEPATAEAGPGDLAYVIYTSGSSGQPKGVQITHRNVVNFLLSMRRRPGLSASDTLLAVTSVSFDIAVLELLLPLVAGAKVVIAAHQEVTDPERLVEALQRSGATVMQATPATWNMMIGAGWRGVPGLTVLCGGERMSGQLAHELAARSRSVWNMYGPTETTVWSTVHRVGSEDEPVPIGQPIANTELYVLDRGMNPMPVNVPGELYIGGAGLSPGYLNRPDLTAAAFVASPFDPAGRLYRTGDLACYLASGEIEVIGRVDAQVKIRGVRTEPAEVEHVLSRHPGVREAAVVVRSDRSGAPVLAGYAVLAEPSFVSARELRDYLKEQLPEQMVPDSLTVLEGMPRLPNGKIDRNALNGAPATKQDDAAEPASFGPVESTIADIWRDVLGTGELTGEANFFDIGGHSLTAMQVLLRLRRAFDLELPIRSIFDAPTIASLAELVSSRLHPEHAGVAHGTPQ